MKRIAFIVALLSSSLWAQTTTTITGTIKDLTNTVVTSGKVTFTLTPNRDTTISGIARFTPTTVTCLINGSGLIKAQDGTSTCTLTMNTALSPSGTYYTVAVWPYFVKTSSFNFYAVLSTYDWSTVVPTPATSPAQNYVDVFSNQTIGGNKTFTGLVTFGSAALPSNVCLVTSTLAAAVTCASTNGVIEFPAGYTGALSGNVTIPSGVATYFDGNSCLTTTGFTLTINGPLVAPLTQIFCGSGTVTGLTTAYPEWWGNNGTCVAGPCSLVSVAVNALNPSVPGTVCLQNTIYRSGFEEVGNVATLTRSGVKIRGGGMPQYNGSFTSFVSGTGTIIQGSWHVEADNFEMSNVGIDTGSAMDAALYSSVGVDAFIMNNNGQVVSKPPKTNPLLINIAALGQSASAAFHAILIENVTGGYAQNLQAVFNTHGVVLKGDHTTINGVYSKGHNTDDVIVKSDDYAPTHDDSLSNLHLDVINAGDTAAGVVINPQAAAMSNVNISGVTVGGTGGTGDGIFANLNFASDHISISNVDIKGGTKQSVCFHASGTAVGTAWQVSNFACDNYNYLIFQTQLLSSSQFSNIVGTNIGTGANPGMLLEGIGLDLVNVTQSGTFTTGASTDCASCIVRLSNWELPGYAGTLTATSNGALIFPGATTSGTYSPNGYFGAAPAVTINNVSAVAVGTASGTAASYVLRDNTNGGSAIVLNDANSGPTIIGGVGTTAFVTGAPGATQVQVSNVAGQLKLLGGGSRNNAVISWSEFGN